MLRVSRAGPWLMITARDRAGQTDGQITLQFYGPNAELRSWDVIDATGARTRITLSNVTQPASFDRSLFRLEDVLSEPPGRRASGRCGAPKLLVRQGLSPHRSLIFSPLWRTYNARPPLIPLDGVVPPADGSSAAPA